MGTNQKMKLLYLYQILAKKTDDTHSMSVQDMIGELEHYGIHAERKTIYTDIKVLNDFGADIIGQKVGRSYSYHIGNREFELAELKLLVDAVQSSRFITHKKSKELIKKIEGLTSIHQARSLQGQVFVAERIKTMNESIYYNIDILHEAINTDRKVSFEYYNWDVYKKLQKRHNGEIYRVSPWGVCWNNEWYYLIAFDDKAKEIRHYRVDKMKELSLTQEQREGKKNFKSLDMAVYTKRRFGMFDGREEKVHLLCRNDFAGIMIDRFGKDVPMHKIDEEHFETTVEVAVSSLFLGWLIGLGEGVRISGPQKVVDMMKKEINRLSQIYQN